MKRTTALVLIAVLIGSAVFGYWTIGSRRSLMRQLGRSTPERTFAARLSMPTEHHACRQLPANGNETVRREQCAKLQNEAPLPPRVLTAARESSNPDSLQASAVAAVIWWDDEEASLHEAILRLQKALRLTPKSVSLLVDLSAAHLVRAERTGNSRDLLQAHDYAEQALAREPRNHKALWNAALALQSFGLDREANEAWDAYLAIDSKSRWAREARMRQDSLITRLPRVRRPTPREPDSVIMAFAGQWPQEARELGFESVLGDWGGTLARDAARAHSLLDFAERLGRALEQRPGGDASLAEAVRAIRGSASDATATAALARAHRAYADGRAEIKAAQVSKARDAFSRVLRHQPKSAVLLHWATVFLAATEADSLTLLQLVATVDSTQPALAGRARLALGRIFLVAGNYPEARKQSSIAQELLRNAGETELQAGALSTHGEAAYESGDTVEAYRSMHRVQMALRPYNGSQALHNNLMALGKCAVLDEMPRAALAVYSDAVRVMKGTGTPINVLEILQYRAGTRAAVGDPVGATRDLDSAIAWIPKLPPDQKQQEWARARIRIASPERFSAAVMDSTVTALSDRVLWLIPALLWRADALLAAGNLTDASLDLDSVTAVIQGLSTKESEARLRAAMIEQVRSRFDQLVMLYLRAGRTEDALRVLERGRVSFASQRDRTSASGISRLAPARGQNAVAYALTGDTLLAWLLRPDSTPLFYRSTIDRNAFLLTVEQVGAGLESAAPSEVTRPGLRRLYDLLIRPVRDRLGGTEMPLVIVADGEVASVPFEALWDEDRNRYLIEDRPLRYAATLADAARPPSAARAASGDVLLVADPWFEPLAYPTLDRLLGARAEVDSLRTIYRTANLLADSAATPDSFAALAQSAGVIHYAGHAVFDDARPERSFLVLAGAGNTGRLTAQAVDSMELRGAPLVVLSTCRTLRSRAGRSGGFAGLSGALLDAGASGVVGSLWQANDRLTQPLMMAFHRQYGRRHDPALALREAQLQMIRSGDAKLSSPAAWAGFRYMGN